MEILTWIVLSIGVGYIWKKFNLSFISGVVWSLIFSPIGGLIIGVVWYLLKKRKKTK